jgi:hypothetical protein
MLPSPLLAIAILVVVMLIIAIIVVLVSLGPYRPQLLLTGRASDVNRRYRSFFLLHSHSPFWMCGRYWAADRIRCPCLRLNCCADDGTNGYHTVESTRPTAPL